MTALALPRPAPGGSTRLGDVRRRSLLVAQLRVLLVVGGFLLLAVIALARIAWIGVVQPGPSEHDLSSALLPERGEITDRNGVPLARDFPAYALWYDPHAMGSGPPLVKPAAVVARDLKAIFPDLEVARVTALLKSDKPGYIRRRILPSDANKVLKIGELALELPRETERHYPQGRLAANVLGYVGADGKGHVGMEEVLNHQLTDPATRGTPQELSIDVRVQGALEDELRRGMLMVHAIGAAGIVLNANTGEVLAMASLPEFDPNNVTKSDLEVTPKEHAEGILAPVFNRATNQVFELGSTFKPFTVAAAIDSGSITNLARRYSAKPFMMGGFKIKDMENMGPTLNVVQTLIHSSNVVTAQIVQNMGAPTFKTYLERLEMNKRAQIDLPARGFPIWPHGKWPLLRAMTIGYGHGLAVTPLHLALGYAALVNGGIWRPATLLKLPPGEIPHGHRVFKASTSARMDQLLRMVVKYGTGRAANDPGFRVGGKTGSAEKPGPHGYMHHKLISTFAAAFPMDHPQYVVVVMLDEPKGTPASSYQRTAAWNAVPIVGRLIPRIGPMLGVYPDIHRDIDLSDLAPLVTEGWEGQE